jgi:hypothetical protein
MMVVISLVQGCLIKEGMGDEGEIGRIGAAQKKDMIGRLVKRKDKGADK